MPGKTNELLLMDIEKEFSSAPFLFFGRISSLKVSDLFELRSSIRSAGRRCMVVKNQLARIALKKAGHEAAGKLLDSMSCVFTAVDEPQSISKVLVEFQKGHQETFKINGALIDGRVVDESYVKQLASLPSKQELRAKAVGAIKAPINGFVLNLRGLLQTFVLVLKAASEKPAAQ